MNNAELIQDYLDGLLPPEQESQLFSELASSDALRAELKQEIAVREAIRGDAAAFSPSVGSTLNIFSSLGFAPPPAAVVAPLPVAKPFLTNLLMNFKQGIISMLSTAFVGVLVYFSVLQPADNAKIIENNIVNGGNGSRVTNTAQNSQSDIPVSSSHTIESNSAAKEPAVRVITKTVFKPYYVYVEDTTGNSPTLDVAKAQAEKDANQLIAALAEKPTEPTHISRGCADLRQEFSFAKPRYGFVSPTDYQFSAPTSDRKPLGFQLEWNGSTMWNNPDATIDPSSYARFNNNSVALYYELSDNWIVGAGLRQETFFQDFYGTDSVGRAFRYEQQPNLTTYGLSLRYRSDIYWGFCSLLTQATFGLNTAGPVARGTFGTEISISRSFSFVAGLEYSALFYQHQNKNFNSSKFGFIYGLNFKF